MRDDDDPDDDELVARIFALLTAKFEDAAAIAADCQARERNRTTVHRACNETACLTEEAATLIAAARRLKK
jgi:hypothetical protein